MTPRAHLVGTKVRRHPNYKFVHPIQIQHDFAFRVRQQKGVHRLRLTNEMATSTECYNSTDASGTGRHELADRPEKRLV